MSTTVRANCERCGTVDVPIDSALLEMPLQNDTRTVALLTCPTCGAQIAMRIGERATRLLSAAGIGVTVAQPAPERAPVSDS